MEWKDFHDKRFDTANDETVRSLEPFFYPKNVAIIGASGQKGSVGYTLFQNALSSKLYKKNVFAVNPNHPNVQGHRAYKNVKDIPQDIDLAVIAVPAPFVPQTILDCNQKKVEAVIVISAGFGEIGNTDLDAKLHEAVANARHTRIIGPNCFGVYVGDNQLNTTFSEAHRIQMPKNGSVSFMSQSGALGLAILDWMGTQQFGLGKFISYGNAIDVDESDLLEYLGADDKTKVITAYLEGAKHGRKFLQIAKRVTTVKPVIVLKGGLTEETHKATASHTGSLAGNAALYHALFRQTGIVQANGLEELFAFAKTLANEPLPAGNRVQIITNGGGLGIITADQVIQTGLKLAQMTEATKTGLREKLPKTATVSNPMDLVGDADIERYKIAIDASLQDPDTDMVLVLVLFNTPAIDETMIDYLADVRKKAKKPLVVLSTGGDFTYQARVKLEKKGLATYAYPSHAALSLKALSDYAAWRREHG